MPTYAVMVQYGDRAARDKARPSHREYLGTQLAAGNLVYSGPFADDSGALLVYEAESESALRELLDRDPYWMTEGVLSDITIKEWTILFQRGTP